MTHDAAAMNDEGRMLVTRAIEVRAPLEAVRQTRLARHAESRAFSE